MSLRPAKFMCVILACICMGAALGAVIHFVIRTNSVSASAPEAGLSLIVNDPDVIVSTNESQIIVSIHNNSTAPIRLSYLDDPFEHLVVQIWSNSGFLITQTYHGERYANPRPNKPIQSEVLPPNRLISRGIDILYELGENAPSPGSYQLLLIYFDGKQLATLRRPVTFR